MNLQTTSMDRGGMDAPQADQLRLYFTSEHQLGIVLAHAEL